ncbi:MAG: glycoside hydrolase family 3 C-terminal domain-containing protein, partial [[Eubacterium] siraeum]|nr:glycoside hydrolase family 3 C-terminal domain-containing protein [[Eubacterium] siraeum]
EIYGKPFQAAISESGLKGIMPCYCTINGESVSASEEYLQKLLREDMGFEGVVVSDYGAVGNVHGVHRLEESYEEAGLRCLKAGMDMELPSPTGFNDKLKELFAEGKADMAVLDRAVLKVLTAKFRMGLFDSPFAAESEELHKILEDKKGAELSLKSARESMVLLKNDGALPLSKNIKRIALIGPHAAFANKMFGGYTQVSMQESTLAAANSIAGVSGSVQTEPDKIVTVPGTNIQSDETPDLLAIVKHQKPHCKSLLEELRDRLPEAEIYYAYGYPIAGTDESRFEEALEAAENADAVILTLGGRYGTCSMSSMGEGIDASNINLPPCQDSFIRKAAALGKPVVGVHFDGRPISSDTADECLNAILEAWAPSETGAIAAADILLGDYNPSGKMPVTAARNAGQIPVYYNHPNGSAWHQSGSIGFADYVDLPHTPRYYFGHGLSYTDFEYSDIRISQKEIAPDASVEIGFTVKNIGKLAGDEVVQLYLIDEYASMTRPVKELAGFKRISLEAGESRRVTFTVKADQMAFLDINMQWKIEKGRFFVEIGSSSEDIRLKGEYTVTESVLINGKERSFYAKARVE